MIMRCALSFFATLEYELIERERFTSHAEARLAIFSFIEGWYNPQRRHSALDYQSPQTYENYTKSDLQPQAADCPRKEGNSNV